MASEAKCALIVLKVCRFTISVKVSLFAVPCNHFETGYSGKHTVSRGELYLYLFQKYSEMPRMLKVMMAMIVSVMTD